MHRHRGCAALRWVARPLAWVLQVIVVDVEDRDDSVWHNLTPLDGGLSGWRLLWDRWCPIPSFRCLSAVTRLSHGLRRIVSSPPDEQRTGQIRAKDAAD